LGVIDEYRIMVYPVLVGGGIPFFPQRERRVDLELVETRTFSSRVVYQGTALHFGTGKGHALSNERFFGEMLGVPIGTLFSNRQSLHDAEVHVSPQPR
jgi:hypothetical protein